MTGAYVLKNSNAENGRIIGQNQMNTSADAMESAIALAKSNTASATEGRTQ